MKDIQVITGCMFAGKTTELINRLKKSNKTLKWEFLVKFKKFSVKKFSVKKVTVKKFSVTKFRSKNFM